jgi:sugar phosphate isomerase/epimerase
LKENINMTKLPIGIQLYTLRDFMAKDFRGTLEAVKEMGYDCVEFAGLFDNSAEDVRAMCEEIGLDPISAHVGIYVILENIEGVVKTYADIGCRFIVIPSCEEQVHLVGGSDYEGYLANIKKIAAEARKYGMTLLYHNHDFEFHKHDGKNKLDILYADTDANDLQTQIDTCWARVGGEDPAEYVKKYSGRAPLVHIKDYAGQKTENMYGLIDTGKKEEVVDRSAFELRPVGYGVQDVASIVKASEEAGAVALIVEQDRPSMEKNPMECAEMSIR